MIHLARPRVRPAVLISTLALGTAACGGSPDADAPAATDGQQLSGPRLVVTTDDGLRVLDAESLETVAELPADGFVRVNPAGDDRHVLVSTKEGFQLLDTAVEVDDHGDHAHYAVDGEPGLGDTFAAPEPGHVTVHDGRTALFSDGAGTVRLLDADDPTQELESLELPAPHHGVAVAVGENLLHTEGTAEERSSVVLRSTDGEEIARTDDCPGVHGEATAADGRVVVGCEDGAVVLDGERLTKVASPDGYGRVGNQAGSSASPIVLGDYKTDREAELERPEHITLVDTESKQIDVVELGTSYSFRSLARGAAGEAIVLGTDGALHVLDARDGARLSTIPVVDAWQEPTDWQAPRPTVHVDGDTACVTDPASRTLHAVDVPSGKVVQSVDLGATPNEVVSAGAHG